MDQGTLVESQIAEGQKLIDQLIAAGVDVTAAAWVKPTERSEWRLYIVSKMVDESGLTAAYRAAHPALQQMPDPWEAMSSLKFIGPSDPIAADILDLQRRNPGRAPTRSRRPHLGRLAVDETYVYPAPVKPEERWRGIAVMVFPEVGAPAAYRVEFWPDELQALRGPGGQPRRVPRPASVRVEGGQVTEYQPPEEFLPHLRREDYEQKALEAGELVVGRSA